MKLSEYLKLNNITQADFARKADESPQNIERYVNNKRIPRPQKITKIKIATEGLVTAEDFNELSVIAETLHSNKSGELQ